MSLSVMTFSLMTLTLVYFWVSPCKCQGQLSDCASHLKPAFDVLVPPPGFILTKGGKLTNTRPALTLSTTSNLGQVKVMVEAFLDLMCWESAEEWRALKQVADRYDRQNVTVVVHMVPLPYHRNSIIGLQGLLWYRANKPHQAFHFVDAMFTEDIFRTFTNDATEEMNYYWIRTRLTNMAVDVTNITADHFMYNIDDHFEAARATWKYSASRGVAGAPWYFINGVVLNGASETVITYDMWIQYIDGLLNKKIIP